MAIPVTPKSEATRKRILEAALQVFRERSFEAATMREIAAAAGMAVGAAYYYYDSKEALVMAFYEQSQQEMAPTLDRILASYRTLEQRLRGIIGQKLEYFAPNRALVAALSAHIDPEHPLSPFSAATAPIRDHDIAFFTRAVDESKLKLPPSILPYLPRLLWLYQMGIFLFWIYDRSPRQTRTRLLFDKTLAMMLVFFKLAQVPALRPLLRPAGELLKAIYGEPAP
ncbi:MAG TPA: TetR family transcriptional regulator [Acidobacteriaceae bacterium]|nr:TetR family transcriptional regulator [Acidobacteriaceae bacterium]HUB00573.1 TetR family transcriptional regulator [Terracidiphilus sp.]